MIWVHENKPLVMKFAKSKIALLLSMHAIHQFYVIVISTTEFLLHAFMF